ncbi:FxLYD domain-containing protein [Parageobacillus toebii]|uniref:FxLYD domain-containing protein n=1 Tax=Parageobacillus toebii TaxID=153151 RepID=UPI002E2422CF|nr:zinc-ribbon domain-containing protein [Parageobacillus toebii]
MFCHQCGEKVSDQARFCPQCGVPLREGEQETDHHLDSVVSAADEESNSLSKSEQAAKYSKVRRLLPIAIPVASLIIVASSIAGFYGYEQKVNAQVVALQKKAEELALKGEYERAEKELNKALNLRPNYTVLSKDIHVIRQAEALAKGLQEVDQKIKQKQYDEAAEQLENVKKEYEKRKGPLFNPFQKEITRRDITITVGKIKQELDELTTIEQLADKLNIVSTLSSEEGKQVKEQITNKIVQIASTEAEKEAKNKQFSKAISILDKGLQYAVNDEKLLSVKEKVKNEQAAFEKAEQERIEQAMKAAAQEDLKNRTAAVEVTALNANVDEYGDLYINGEIKNVATKGIYSITIYYTITDAEGNYLDDGFTTVYPYYVKPGDTGTFEDIYYGVNENAKVAIDNITWYLD